MVREIKKPKYSISDYDKEVFSKIQDGKYQERQFIKIYDSLFNIEDFTTTTILVYSVIRNQIYITSLHNGNDANASLVGLSTFIPNDTFSHYGIVPRSLYRSLDTLKDYGFISATTGTNRKTGRVITLLRDVKEYQPEELKLLKGNNTKVETKTKVKIDNTTDIKNKKDKDSKITKSKNKKQDIQDIKQDIQDTKQDIQTESTKINSTEMLGEGLDDFEF